MKTWTLRGALVALLAAPFGVLALAIDVPTATKALTVVVVAALSLAVSWGTTDGFDDIYEEAKGGRMPAWLKRLTAFALAFLPFESIVLGTTMRTWFPGGRVVAFWCGVALGAGSLALWPWIKRTVVARVAREILSKPLVKRDAQGNIGVKADPEDKTNWHRPDGTPMDASVDAHTNAVAGDDPPT